MNRQTLVVFAFVAAAGLGGAWALGLLSPAAPPAPVDGPVTAPPPPPPQPRDTTAPAARRAERPAPAVRAPSPDAPAAATPEPVAPTTATLRIDSDVPGAQVFLDNRFVGPVPATATDVMPGQRKINVQAPGYEGVIEYVMVEPGPRDLTISLRTIRLDQQVSVTHKHRLGACHGTLIATPDGLRYDTDNREDGFRVALVDLEIFTADFLKNSLRIKVRGGRTYDFAGPGGKAEGLYLFHQEVEKVRQRMLKERQ